MNSHIDLSMMPSGKALLDIALGAGTAIMSLFVTHPLQAVSLLLGIMLAAIRIFAFIKYELPKLRHEKMMRIKASEQVTSRSNSSAND